MFIVLATVATVVNYYHNMFIAQATEVNVIKLCGANLWTLFCKLDPFINVTNICFIVVKRCNLQKVSKLMAKMFY